MDFWLFLPSLLLCKCALGQSEPSSTTGLNLSFGTSLEAWIVLGVVLFGASFVLCFTWIMFFYVLRRNKREHDEFLQALHRRRMNRERRNQTLASAGLAGRTTTPPLAISYRRNTSSTPEVYVSLSQLTALNRQQGRTRHSPRRPPGPTHVSFEMDVHDPDDSAPSAPPFPDSPPDYYEYMTQQDHGQASPHMDFTEQGQLHSIEEHSETEEQEAEV